MLITPTLVRLGLIRSGLVSGIFGPDDGATCNTYLFSSTNPDLLSFDSSFTGNLKVILAAPAETGIHPDIVAGRQGDFITSADPVKSPNWIQYEIEASAIGYIVDATFDGVVGLVGLDDVFYKIDAGVPQAAYSVFVSTGQSLSIGTLNPDYNTNPAQPELTSNHRLFNGIPSTGIQNVLATDNNTVSLVDYVESGNGGFYGHGTGLFKNLGLTKDAVFLSSGIGGAPLQDLDLGGALNAYANQVKYYERLSLIDPFADVKMISLIHGDANYLDTISTYYQRIVQFKQNQLSLCGQHFPSSNPKFISYQQGGERSVKNVQFAQQDAYLNGLFDNMTSATYWLNRQYPNHDLRTAPSIERVHLNPDGYRYLGDMVARAYKGEKPVIATKYEWVDSKTVRLTCANHNLTVDTTQLNMPEFSGYGIELARADGALVEPLSVVVSGSTITLTFDQDVNVSDRIRIGLTPADMSYYSNDVPTTGYPAAMTGTNIRSTVPHSVDFALPDYYDWLCIGYHTMTKEDDGFPAYTLGSNCWWNGTSQGSAGFGERFVWDGVNQTKTIDGQDIVTPTSGFVVGSTSENLYYAVRSGKTYRVSGYARNETAGAQIRLQVGNFARVTITDGFDGNFSQDITCDQDYRIELRVTNTAIIGEIRDIEIREVL